MAAFRGLSLAFFAFAASFVLHIVGGASGQDWLFAIAVALIFVTATAFPIAALAASRAAGDPPHGRAVLTVGSAVGVFLTGAALWAANGRAFAAWEPPAAVALVVAVSGGLFVLYRLARRGGHQTQPHHPPA